MDAYRTVLFLHLLALFIGIGTAAILGLSLFRLRGASTGAEALPWSVLAGKTERAAEVRSCFVAPAAKPMARRACRPAGT